MAAHLAVIEMYLNLFLAGLAESRVTRAGW
jgi:hypothetical protein